MHRMACQALLLTVALLGAASWPALSMAQTVPSLCKPLGNNLCAANKPRDYVFKAFACGQGNDLNFPSAQQAYNHADQILPPTPSDVGCPTESRQNLGLANGLNYPNDFGVCFGPPGVRDYPISHAAGFEKENWTLWRDTFYKNPGCQLNQSTAGVVRQQRIGQCPEAWGGDADSAFCFRSDDDPDLGKNLGNVCPIKGQCTTGNPINIGIGGKYQRETDFIGSGPNPLRLERFYNSWAGLTPSHNALYRFSGSSATNTAQAKPVLAALNPANDQNIASIATDAIGVSWRHTYHRAVVLSTAPDLRSVSVYREDGRILTFMNYSGQWISDADVNYTVTEQTSAGQTTGWTVTTPNDSTETYSAVGKLLSITDRNGVSISLTYDSAGRLELVQHEFGHTLTFGYAESPQSGMEWWETPGVTTQIDWVEDPAGNRYDYTYDAEGRLTSVTYPDLNIREYLYTDTNFIYALTGIIDGNGDQYATFEYDSSGRASVSYHGQGVEVTERVDVAYEKVSPISAAFNIRKATVTHASGTPVEHVREVDFGLDRQLGMAKMGSSSHDFGGSQVSRSLTYDANGNVDQETDFDGTLIDRNFDLVRNLETSRTEASGTAAARTTTTVWHPSYRLPDLITMESVYSAGTHQIDYVYFPGSPLVQRIDESGFRPDGTAISRSTAFTYNSDGQVLTIDGPRTDLTDVTTFRYYNCVTGSECGQLREVENALGQITSYDTYNGRGQLVQKTDPNGLVTMYTYDDRGRVLSITETPTIGTPRTVSMTYDNAGQLITTTQPNGEILTNVYDTAHKLKSVTDNFGNSITYAYDARGNRTDEDTYDPGAVLKRQLDYVYDVNDRLDSINNGGFVTDLIYDTVGNLTDETDPNLDTTSHSYDALNRLIETIDALSGQTDYAYDVKDNLISVTAPNNAQTTYEYDDFGNQLKEVSPDRGTLVYTYDEAGNRKTMLDARSKLTSYDYDALNRVTLETLHGGATITFQYDTGTNAIGRLNKITDPSGNTAWSYDNFGAVTQKVQTIGAVALTIGYGYDANGRPTTITLPSGKVVTYGYNVQQPTSVTVDSTPVLSGATYEPFGRANAWTWSFGPLHQRAYDLRGLPSIIDLGGEPVTLTRDPAGQITTANFPISGFDFVMDYDALGRLTDFASLPAAAPLPAPDTQVFTYDANGNRESLTEDGVFYNYTNTTNTNRVSSTTGPVAKTYTYDAAGNVTNDGVNTYGYDDRGRLVSLNSGAATYEHNGQGQRVKKDVGGAITLFAYDEQGRLLGEYDGAGSAQMEHVWFDGEPVAAIKGPIIFGIDADHTGTPRIIFENWFYVWIWNTGPFGETPATEFPDSTGALFTYNLRFPGQYYDAESGLHYNYFRTYDPATGRYTQSDPIGLLGGNNTYDYARQSPVNKIDPTGLFTITNDYGSTGPKDGGGVFCDGKGGFVIKLFGALAESECLRECALAHEESHISDIKSRNPTICTGISGQPRIGASDTEERNWSERNAYLAEKACLRGKLEECGGTCESVIRERIQEVNRQLFRFM